MTRTKIPHSQTASTQSYPPQALLLSSCLSLVLFYYYYYYHFTSLRTMEQSITNEIAAEFTAIRQQLSTQAEEFGRELEVLRSDNTFLRSLCLRPTSKRPKLQDPDKFSRTSLLISKSLYALYNASVALLSVNPRLRPLSCQPSDRRIFSTPVRSLINVHSKLLSQWT
ncbi:hypothetical protein ACMFMG_005584 [Clarireedia jacksonii]